MTDQELDRAIHHAVNALKALEDAKTARERGSSDNGSWYTDFASECLVRSLHRLGHVVPMPACSEEN